MKVRRAELLTSCPASRFFPPPDAPEVAFLGRSNVGKSSLLNRLVGRKQLARTSSTPGKTRLIHFFEVEAGDTELRLVDLPGYGYAKVSRRERESWRALVEGYLGERPSLRLAILLQDIRRDFSEDETLLLEWLDARGVASAVVLTKSDKLKSMRRKARRQALAAQLPERRLLATSAQKGEGMEALWGEILERCR